MKGGDSMKIEITAMTLASLLKDHFSYEACEEIVNYYEELDETWERYKAPTLGDLCIHFAELNEEDIDDDDVVAKLSNGKVLVVR